MGWYRIRFTREEASTRIAELAQDFLDTVQISEIKDGIALYRRKTEDAEQEVVYYLCLNTTRPSAHLTDVYGAESCPPPEVHTVDHFGGDDTVLGLRE